MNDPFETAVKKYNNALNLKVQNGIITFERYEFLLGKLMSWVDTYDPTRPKFFQ